MATAERALYRSGPGRHRRYGLGLPVPPTEVEKYWLRRQEHRADHPGIAR